MKIRSLMILSNLQSLMMQSIIVSYFNIRPPQLLLDVTCLFQNLSGLYLDSIWTLFGIHSDFILALFGLHPDVTQTKYFESPTKKETQSKFNF